MEHLGHDAAADALVAALRRRSVGTIGVRTVASTVATMIRAGELPEGTRLPPVRQLAADLGISPTTVAAAWAQLASLGLVAAQGRRGTFVASPPRRRPRRWQQTPPQPARYDLGTGAPDPRLLPDPVAYLPRIAPLAPATYADPPVFGPLVDVLVPLLPPALQLRADTGTTIVDGALEAIDRLLGTVAPSATAVAVEDPSFPALFDLVEAHGLSVWPLPIDAEGPDPSDLARLAARPELGAVIIQPRAHNPTGATVSDERRDALAAALAPRPDVLVIEDDHSGLVASTPLASLAGLHPASAYVLSFSKSHGPDLRLAAIITDADRRDALEHARSLGPSWSPKLLQALLAAMLEAPEETERLEHARATYAARRERLADALGRNLTGDGVNAWLSPDPEALVALELAAHGVRTVPGAAFTLGSSFAGAVRITLAEPHHDFDEVLAFLERARLDTTASRRERALGR